MIRNIKSTKMYFLLGGISAITIGLFLSFTLEKGLVQADNIQNFPQNYKVLVPYIPSELDFAGERVPLENFDVREKIEREFIVNTYYHSATTLYIKRAARWFPIIEEILDEYGVPDDFKYIAIAESGLENVTT